MSHPAPQATPLRTLAVASGLGLLGLLSLSLWTGANQQHFEMVLAPATYARDLLAQAQGLKLIVALDDVFIACYVTLTLLLVAHLDSPAAPALRPWILAMGVAAGLLDFIENHHILAMLHEAQAGALPSMGELVLRENLSSLKWLVGHLAFFMVGWSLPTHTLGLRLFRFALVALQMPVGVLALTVQDPMWAPWLNLARLLNVMGGFFLVALLFPIRPAIPPTVPK